MAFLSALSEEDRKIKNAKQERLRAELAEQVQAKREQKRLAKAAKPSGDSGLSSSALKKKGSASSGLLSCW